MERMLRSGLRGCVAEAAKACVRSFVLKGVCRDRAGGLFVRFGRAWVGFFGAVGIVVVVVMWMVEGVVDGRVGRSW